MPEVTDEQIVKEIHKVLKSKSDLEKFTFEGLVRHLEQRLNTILVARTRFLTKSIDGHLLSNFEDVSPAEEMITAIPKVKLTKMKVSRVHKDRSITKRTSSSSTHKSSKTNGERAPKSARKPSKVPAATKAATKALLEGAPKKPATPFFAYSGEQRSALLKTNPGLSITETTTELAKMWRALTPEEKEAYEKQYREASTKYEEDFKIWKNANPEKYAQYEAAKKEMAHSAKGTSKRRTVSKDTKPESTTPRKPNPYLVFRGANREALKSANPNFGHQELEAKIGEMWKQLSAEEKKKYEDQAAEAKPSNGQAASKGTQPAKVVKPLVKRKVEDDFIKDEVSDEEESDDDDDDDKDAKAGDASSSSSTSSSDSESGSGSSSDSSSDSGSGSDSDSSSSSSSEAESKKATTSAQTSTQPAKRPPPAAAPAPPAPPAKKKRVVVDEDDE